MSVFWMTYSTSIAVPEARFLMRSGAHYLVVGEARVLYFGTEGSLTRLVRTAGSTEWIRQ